MSNDNIFAAVKMKVFVKLIFLFIYAVPSPAQKPLQAYEELQKELRRYIGTLDIIDTHEHLFTPEIIRGSNFLDFMLLFQPNGYDDLRSAGLPSSMFDSLYNEPVSPAAKWKIIKPYWNRTFNTSYSRTILRGIKNLHGIDNLNDETAEKISAEIRLRYGSEKSNWFDRILKDSCRIRYIIQDGYYQPGKDDYFRYAKRFDDWILIRTKYRIDSLAISQMDPIFTLDDLVKSLRTRFEKESREGMVAVKIFIAYSRTLNTGNPDRSAAEKVFKKLVSGNENTAIPFETAKPLQDFMIHKLFEIADEYGYPVAIHTGIQSGTGNYLDNSDPVHLSGLFSKYPDVKFVLYHGSYPFGGKASVLAKTYSNVYIDMNWAWSISPSYSERYFAEWLETVPASKIMAFGGDTMVPENVYSELEVASDIVSKVLSEKVIRGVFTTDEAKSIAKMIFYDNAASVYNLEE